MPAPVVGVGAVQGRRAQAVQPLRADSRVLMSPHLQTGRRSWLRRRNLLRLELGAVALFHLLVAVTIAAAPREQVITPGTSAIFGTVPLYVWVAWFAITGLAAVATVVRVTPLRLWTTWAGAFPLGLAWIYGFSVAVPAGKGNAIFALVWPFLLIWWALTAIRMELGRPGAWWGGD